MAQVLTGATVVTVDAGNRILHDVDVRLDGAVITGVGPALAQPGDTIVDCSGGVILPGLVNVHTHAATGLFRGLADDLPRSFWSPAFQVPGQERFRLEDYQSSLRAVCAELLLNGITCIADRLGNMDKLAPVIEASGLRAVVGHSISDRGGPADWATAERVIEMFGVDPRARVFAGLAPHALDSCSDALLQECARRAEQLGCRVFLHVAQSEGEVAAVRARGHDGALVCLTAAGLTGPHVVAAHGIYLTGAEIDAWPNHRISLAHCPASNLKIEARTLPIHRLHGKVALGLGTDWAATNNSWDLLGEARLAALVGKMLAGDPTVLTVTDMMRMLTIDGARVLGLDHLIGSLEPGKRADLVVMDANRLCMTPPHNSMSNIIYAAGANAVRDVMVDGTWLVQAGRLVRDDETRLAATQDGLVSLPVGAITP
jgi:5-methylthioadenosine/S-adenosylhomocysteine deaminase